MGPMQEVAFKSQNKIFQRLEKISNVAALSPEERYSYDADVKNARDALNRMRYAYDEGEAKGMAAGFEKGMQKGMEKGMEKGKAEAIAEKLNKARQIGLPEDIIAQLFGPESLN